MGGSLLAGLCALAAVPRQARADDFLDCQPDGHCVVLVADDAVTVTLRIDPRVAAKAPAPAAGPGAPRAATPCADDPSLRCIALAAPPTLSSWDVAVDGHVLTIERSSLEALQLLGGAQGRTSFTTEVVDLADLSAIGSKFASFRMLARGATSDGISTKAFGPGSPPPTPPRVSPPSGAGNAAVLAPPPGQQLSVQAPGAGAGSSATASPSPSPPAVTSVGPGAPLPREGTTRLGLADPDLFVLDVVGVGSPDGYHCSGVVIDPQLVLTARHCVPATRIAIGSDLARPLATISIVEAISHPTLDAALLRLAGPAPVLPRPRRDAGDRREPRSQVRLIGFGVDDVARGTGFGTKRAVGVVARGWGCDRRRAGATGCDPAAELVLPTDGGRDTCEGDSGGAVLEPSGATWRLIAITSRPLRSAGPGCGRGGIYVRVDALDAWIREQSEELRR